MLRNFAFKLLLAGLSLLVGEASCLASGDRPYPLVHIRFSMGFVNLLADSLPENKKANGESTDGKSPALIKEVPKSHKQEKPAAVTPSAIVVKPVKMIKPKIIKPVIKIN